MRVSTTDGLSSRQVRTAAVNALPRRVEMFTLVIPAATARVRSGSGTPEEPCRTRGASTRAPSRPMSSKSSAASWVSMAWEVPTATARASTLVAATKLAASSGSVRAPGACTPSLPPTSPSSASTQTARAWHRGDDLGRGGDVRRIGEARPVEHHRGEAEPHRLVHQLRRPGMVEVDGHGGGRVPGEREGRQGDRLEPAVVADRVLADLEDHRGVGPGGSGEEG